MTSLIHLLCAKGICLLPRRIAHEALSWPSLSAQSRMFCSLEAPPRAVASCVFSQPVGGGRLIQSLVILSLICFLVLSAFLRPGMARGLCWTLQSVIVVFCSFMSDHPRVPGCQRGLDFAVETSSSEISLRTVNIFPPVLCGRALLLLCGRNKAHPVLCPLGYEAATGKKRPENCA